MLAVHDIISPSLVLIAFDSGIGVCCRVLTDLKSKASTIRPPCEIPWAMFRNLFNHQNEDVKEIYELWPAVVQIARKTISRKYGFFDQYHHLVQMRQARHNTDASGGPGLRFDFEHEFVGC